MPRFYEQLPVEIVESIEPLSRLSYELREHQKTLLNLYEVAEASHLLEKIVAGDVPEVPSYNHYVSILILGEQYEYVRTQLKSVMAQKDEDDNRLPSIIHSEIKERIEKEFDESLGITATLYQDALSVLLPNGVNVEIRFIDQKQYAISWLWGDAALYINTAPLHAHLSTYPNHFCDAEGSLHADPLTNLEISPWDNVVRLLEQLNHDPLLESFYS